MKLKLKKSGLESNLRNLEEVECVIYNSIVNRLDYVTLKCERS